MSSAPRLRILHVTAAADGAPWLIALATEQKKLGHDVSVVIPSLDGSLGPALQRNGITCHVAATNILSLRGNFARIRVIARLVRLLRRLRPDVVHSHLVPSVVTARIASWIADVPVRIGSNAGPLTLESEMLRAVEIGTAFCDTRTVASCAYTRELFTTFGIPDAQCELIHYAVDHSGFDPARADGPRVRRELGIAADTPLVGMVAYFYPPSDSIAVLGALAGRGLKGHEVLLDAMPRVLRAVPDAKLAFVGRGWGPAGRAYERRLRDRAARLGIAGAVLFTGERSDVPDVLAAFDVSVQPSLTDNLGGSVESLLMARPLVVSNIRGYAETVIHEETGLAVPAGDSGALADAIIRLLRDRDLARRLGEQGRRHMVGGFTLAHCISKTEAMLARCTARAEDHYRLTTMLRRAISAPSRLLPVALNVRRISRKYRGRGPRVRVAQVAAAWGDCDWFVSLCRELTNRDYDVVAIIDRKPGNLSSRLDAADIRYYRLPMTFATDLDRARLPAYVAQLPLAAFRLARILRAENVDIVHSHIFTSVLIARLATALTRARHVAGIAGPRHLEAPLTRKVDELTWRLDDATLAGCRHTRDLYASLGADRERLDCAYYGADAARFDPSNADAAAARRALGIAPEAPLVAMIAHFYPPTHGAQTPPHTIGRGVKGHEDFLAASRIIARRLPDARFVLAGAAKVDRGERYRMQLVEQCRNDELLRDRVVSAGHVEDVASLLAAADVVVQCSLSENLGATIEALLMERPVVATRVGGLPESVRDGVTGLLVPPADPGALANAILRLLDDREQARALGRAGRQLMLERFTAERTADDVAAVYRRVLAKRSAAALAEGASA